MRLPRLHVISQMRRSNAFGTIRRGRDRFDVLFKSPISLKNLIYLNGVHPLSLNKRAMITVKLNPIMKNTCEQTKVSLQAYRTES